jgi:hypothetical protein
VQAETALPAIPASVAALAREVTAGAQDPLGQAELLVNWFRSGQFHYTLNPPVTPPDADPLVDFLTRTRSGSCEQFAGAFVVLARSLGLPSRVVVGFTAGRYSGPGQVTVRGADAHAWPEVYLGPRAGWVSFEPTPQQPSGEVAPEGVVGPSGVNTTVPPTSVGPSTPVVPPAPLTVPTTVPNQGSNTTIAPVATATSGSGPGTIGWILIGTAAVVVLLIVVLLVRRRRRWSPTGRSPDQLALLAQDEVERALRHAGLERPLWQPLDRFFEDLGARTAVRSRSGPADSADSSEAAEDAPALIADGITVARNADAARFDPLGTSEGRSHAAYQAALRVREDLKNRQSHAAD